jgi:hypothetical protein
VGLILLLGLSGCGGGKGTVSGKVVYQGTPVTSGRVTFHAPDHHAVSAPIDRDGRYKAKGVPTGPVQVTVTTPPPVSEAKLEALKKRKGDKTAIPARTVSLPAQYGDLEKSGLRLTVTRGTQPFDINIP